MDAPCCLASDAQRAIWIRLENLLDVDVSCATAAFFLTELDDNDNDADDAMALVINDDGYRMAMDVAKRTVVKSMANV